MEDDNSKNNCIDLLKILRAREKSHIESREYHQRLDKFFKIGTLLSSTAVTYLVSSQDDGIEEIDNVVESDTYVYERYMTFTTTIFSGLSTLLNSASKAESHGNDAKKYGLLANELEVKIRSGNATSEEYNEKSKKYREILENAVTLGPLVSRKNPKIRGMTKKEKQDFEMKEST